jgi:hypothetical protein
MENKGSDKLSIYYFIKLIKHFNKDKNFDAFANKTIKYIKKYKLISELKNIRNKNIAHYYVNSDQKSHMKKIEEIWELIDFTSFLMQLLQTVIGISEKSIDIKYVLLRRSDNSIERTRKAFETFVLSLRV